MSWLFKRLPERHVELLVLALLTLGAISILWLIRFQGEGARITIIILEILLPAGSGLVVPGLLAEDPCLEILLSAPRPSQRTLVERMAIVLGMSAFLAVSVTLLAKHWGIPLPLTGARQLLVWITPLIFFGGLSSTVALLRGRALDGSLVVLAICGFFLIATPLMLSQCLDPQGEPCILMLLTPLLTYIQPQAPNWLASRLLWLCLGFLLVLVSLRLTMREERLIQTLQPE
jgi:hypothetical protein